MGRSIMISNDKVTHVMEEKQFNFTYMNKAHELRVDSNMQNLERVDGGETETEKVDQTPEVQKVANTSISYDNLQNRISRETTTINVSEPIGQEHDTLTWLVGSHVTNTSGENSTDQTHLDHIDTADMFMKVLAVNNCVVIILGCLNLIHAAKTGYKSIHMSGKIQITGMIVQMVAHFLSTHNNEITQIIQTWVVTGGLLIASFYVAKYVFNTHSGQLKNGRHTVTYNDGGSYESALRDGKRHGHGTYTWSDGRRHIGEWFADEEHGRGALIGVRGYTRTGDSLANLRARRSPTRHHLYDIPAI